MYEYDEDFYDYINEGALGSARVVLPALLALLPHPVASVLDVGCGAGAWLSVWKSLGAEVVGLDGPYVDTARLLISPDEFIEADLTDAFALSRPFGLVQSLEVAEHLPGAISAQFVECLCRHSDLVLFSAAPPGQGGENHINEQPYDFWRELFRKQGYELYDPLRSLLLGRREVKPWYRYNTLLYLSHRCSPELRAALSPFRVEEGQSVADLSPRLYQLRKRLIALLPSGASTALAIIKRFVFGLSLKIKSALG